MHSDTYPLLRKPLFSVLGALQVGSSDTSAAVSGRRAQRLLLLLLSAANQPVCADQLIDGVWDGSPSPTATSNLRVLVWRWRKALPATADGGERIPRTPGGYRIVVGRDELDAFHFEDLVDTAHRAAASGDHHLAEVTFRTALQLWRGTAYPDLTTAAAQSAALEEKRRQAMDGLVSVLLGQGRHSEAIPLLRGLTVASPHDEHSCERLMVALCRCGRRGDALAVYQQAQTFLARDFGVRPTRRLQVLRRTIEAADR